VAAPIVIVGGFLTDPPRYRRLGLLLHELSGRPVFVASISLPDWLWATAQDDFTGLLRKLSGTVSAVLRQTGAARVEIVAHSMGGLLSRLYLGDQPYGPHKVAFAGYQRVTRLVTVGTPHQSQRAGRQAGLNQVRWVMQRYPGAYWPSVEYVTVMGSGIVGRPAGSLAERAAYAGYTLFDGRGDQVGDGVVPLSCGMLEGARQIELPDVHHGPRALRPWYGEDAETLLRWWS